MPDPVDHAVVVQANNAQFRPGGTNQYPCVRTRMLVWCKSGLGSITVNAQRYSLRGDEWLFLPWEHSIAYRADGDQPFLIAGVHTIPDHDRNHPVTFRPAHDPDEPLWRSPHRRDRVLPGIEGVCRGSLTDSPALGLLAEYVVSWFQRGRFDESDARRMGQAILREMILVAEAPGGGRPLPGDLRRTLAYIDRHIDQPIRVERLATVAGCSVSTLSRRFREHLETTPMEYLAAERMVHARRLLSGSQMQIGEIARRVGVDDPYYFSRLFKARVGVSPRQYRRANALA